MSKRSKQDKVTIDQLQFVEAPEGWDTKPLPENWRARTLVEPKVKHQPKKNAKVQAPDPPCSASRKAYEAIKAQNNQTLEGWIAQYQIDHGCLPPPWEWKDW